MRRAIVALAAVALLLAMVAVPAAAYPKNSTLWDTACDMDGDGEFDTYFVQAADHRPGWMVEPVAIKAPSIWMGGHGELTIGGVLYLFDEDTPPAMVSKVTYCMQEATFVRDGVTWHMVWDPLWLFFSPPAIP